MKRILAITLALILILSCCPSVYAAAEESSDNSYSLSDMDPKIKKIIDSKIPQAEKEELIALVPDLSDAQLLNVIPFGPWHCIEKPQKKLYLLVLSSLKEKQLYLSIWFLQIHQHTHMSSQ